MFRARLIVAGGVGCLSRGRHSGQGRAIPDHASPSPEPLCFAASRHLAARPPTGTGDHRSERSAAKRRTRLRPKLARDGVATQYANFTHVMHEFFGTPAVITKARQAIALAAAALDHAAS